MFKVLYHFSLSSVLEPKFLIWFLYLNTGSVLSLTSSPASICSDLSLEVGSLICSRYLNKIFHQPLSIKQ